MDALAHSLPLAESLFVREVLILRFLSLSLDRKNFFEVFSYLLSNLHLGSICLPLNVLPYYFDLVIISFYVAMSFSYIAIFFVLFPYLARRYVQIYDNIPEICLLRYLLILHLFLFLSRIFLSFMELLVSLFSNVLLYICLIHIARHPYEPKLEPQHTLVEFDCSISSSILIHMYVLIRWICYDIY